MMGAHWNRDVGQRAVCRYHVAARDARRETYTMVLIV
jgi:hypothetical protein